MRRRANGVPRLLVVAWCATGCADGPAPLANSYDEPLELIEAALGAVEAREGEVLRDLLVSREEFEAHLWPAMPDREYTRLDFVWGTMAANTRKGVRQLENTYGGIPIEVVSIEMPPEDEVEVYERFSFHTGVKVAVRRLDTGQEGILPSFDGLLQYDGRWKLLNFDEL